MSEPSTTFATINFYNNGSVNKTNPFLTISASSPTTIKSLSGVNLTGFEGLQGTYTLINNNTGGFTINDGKRTKTEMMGVTERSIFIDSANKNLLCTIYQFKDVTATQATALDDGSGALYAGRSKMGNSTVNNKLTMGSGNYTDVFGGKTEGTGTPETVLTVSLAIFLFF